jgi:hypothetical protein
VKTTTEILLGEERELLIPESEEDIDKIVEKENIRELEKELDAAGKIIKGEFIDDGCHEDGNTFVEFMKREVRNGINDVRAHLVVKVDKIKLERALEYDIDSDEDLEKLMEEFGFDYEDGVIEESMKNLNAGKISQLSIHSNMIEREIKQEQLNQLRERFESGEVTPQREMALMTQFMDAMMM